MPSLTSNSPSTDNVTIPFSITKKKILKKKKKQKQKLQIHLVLNVLILILVSSIGNSAIATLAVSIC